MLTLNSESVYLKITPNTRTAKVVIENFEEYSDTIQYGPCDKSVTVSKIISSD